MEKSSSAAHTTLSLTWSLVLGSAHTKQSQMENDEP